MSTKTLILQRLEFPLTGSVIPDRHRFHFLFRSLLSITLTFFFFSCSSTKRSAQATLPQAPKISLKQDVQLSMILSQNNSQISKQNWVTQPEEEDVLLGIFDSIALDLGSELPRASQYGRIHLVPQHRFPDYRLQLVYLPIEISKDSVRIPFVLKVYHQSSSKKDFSLATSHAVANIDRRLQSSTYQYWGKILADYRQSFPKEELIGKLFELE